MKKQLENTEKHMHMKQEREREKQNQSDGGDDTVEGGEDVKEAILPDRRLVYFVPPISRVLESVRYHSRRRRRRRYYAPGHSIPAAIPKV